MSQAIKVTSGKGFKFISSVIHETNQQRISIDFQYIPDPKKGGLHHIQFEITKESKKPSEEWENAIVNKIRLSTQEPHESLLKLINALKVQKDLYKRGNSKFIILDEIEANLFKKIGEDNLEFIARILKSFESEEAKFLLTKIDAKDLGNLIASIKHARNKSALIDLKQLVGISVNEVEFKKWINNNTWVFGNEYVKKYDTSVIGLHSEADFIVQSLDGFADLIELKKSNFPLFIKDRSHDCYYPSSGLSQVLGQAIKYLKVMEDSRLIHNEEDGLKVLKPRVRIIIGRSKDMDPEGKKALRLLNSTLHGIDIMTYDEIVIRAKKLIASYEDIEDYVE